MLLLERITGIYCGVFLDQAYKQQVRRLMKQGASVGGMGLQAHFKGDEPVEALEVR